mmetsp:Transcript_20767/g.47132  ORF Transcript_20767/g.47132 Transcript_20767/m.47132 type:complete len:125 (+) Transcript_20767:1321-1695(+)
MIKLKTWLLIKKNLGKWCATFRMSKRQRILRFFFMDRLKVLSEEIRQQKLEALKREKITKRLYEEKNRLNNMVQSLEITVVSLEEKKNQRSKVSTIKSLLEVVKFHLGYLKKCYAKLIFYMLMD